MENQKTLYLVKTRSFRAYVVAEDMDTATNKFTSWLKEHDYGYTNDRLPASITVVADERATSPLPESGRNGICQGYDKLFI